MLFHWICDFVLQTNYQAVNKSTSNRALVGHVGTYSICMSLLLLIFGGFIWGYNLYLVDQCLSFGIVTFVAHFLTDYITSRVNAQLWKEDKRHEFFVSIGLDQWLHLVQLLFTFYFIF